MPLLPVGWKSYQPVQIHGRKTINLSNLRFDHKHGSAIWWRSEPMQPVLFNILQLNVEYQDCGNLSNKITLHIYKMPGPDTWTQHDLFEGSRGSFKYHEDQNFCAVHQFSWNWIDL